MLLILAGCQTGETVTASHEHDDFTIQVSVPEHVQANQPFTIVTELSSHHDQEIEIITGEPIFHHMIWDSNGKAMNYIVSTSIGIHRTLKAQETLSEEKSYTLKEPGTYEISAVVTFTHVGVNDGSEYKLETPKRTIEVTE